MSKNRIPETESIKLTLEEGYEPVAAEVAKLACLMSNPVLQKFAETIELAEHTLHELRDRNGATSDAVALAGNPARLTKDVVAELIQDGLEHIVPSEGQLTDLKEQMERVTLLRDTLLNAFTAAQQNGLIDYKIKCDLPCGVGGRDYRKFVYLGDAMKYGLSVSRISSALTHKGEASSLDIHVSVGDGWRVGVDEPFETLEDEETKLKIVELALKAIDALTVDLKNLQESYDLAVANRQNIEAIKAEAAGKLEFFLRQAEQEVA